MPLLNHLEKLSHFHGVVRAGSIRGYAVKHRLSQPSISKAIHLLEAELETTLLIRSKDGVSLTPAGSDLLKFAEEMIGKSGSVEERFRARGNVKLEGRFVLGTYQSIAVYFLPKLLKHLDRVQKGLRLEFVTAPSTALVAALRAGSVDFIISIDPPVKPGLIHQVLFEDTYSLYAPVAGVTAPSTARVFTLLTARDSQGKTLRSYLERAGILERVIGCGDFEAAKAMVENDLGQALLPENVARALLNAGKIKKVVSIPKLQSIGPHRVVFSYLKHRQADQGIRWIGEQIQLMLRVKK